jgi:hypothetical protein
MNDGATPRFASMSQGHDALTPTLRALVAESGDGACTAQEFAGASWLTPLRRFVRVCASASASARLRLRLRLRVDYPRLGLLMRAILFR